MPELIWEGKYDAQGRKVAPLKVALPFQTVETVNESAADRQKQLDAFSTGKRTAWRNRLIWGDKKYVLPSLLPEFAGQVNLIYIDPPFATGADFSFTARIPDNPETEEDESAEFLKQPSMIEMKAYRDTWGGKNWNESLCRYLKWFYETSTFLHELLAQDGSLFVHCDWHAGHYIKTILDEIFGYENFRNELIWRRVYTHSDSKSFGHIHDTIFFYSKSSEYFWKNLYTPQTETYIESHYNLKDEEGRPYQLISMSAKTGKPEIRIINGKEYKPEGNAWKYSQKTIDSLWEQGKIVFTTQGTPRLKLPLDETKGRKVQSIWTDIFPVNSQAIERIAYDTQKPETLLGRILDATTRENDLVIDCFCGSGTTAAIAEKLNRRWIVADLGRFAIHTTRKRLLGIPNVRPFIVQNLGKYERQIWQSAEFGDENTRRQLAYRKFILDLYHATELPGFSWLHGVKAGRLVHVGSVDSPVTESDLANIAVEFKKAMGTGGEAPMTNGVDVLGWDFAFEVNEVAKNRAELAGLDVHLKKIPMDVMDKRAVDQGDVKFFELAALEVKTTVEKRKLSAQIANFIIPQDDLPEEVRGKITHWSQWIDYWAIDWDYKDDTFHNQWQSYRTRKDNSLHLNAEYKYETAGEYKLLIKVVDILGNDTTKMLAVEVR